MTEEQILKNAHIPTTEIEQDIRDTEREIKDKQDELEVLMRNPTENKVRIYTLNGGISSRRDFVSKLKDVLEYRRKEGEGSGPDTGEKQ